MQDVTPLAERGEVPWAIVRRIVIEMSGRQHDFGAADSETVAHDQVGQGPAAAVDPQPTFLVPTPAVAEVLHLLPVWVGRRSRTGRRPA